MSVIAPVSMPIGGWDAISAIPSIPQDRAQILTNLVPDQGGIEVREGRAAHATGLTSSMVRSLLPWHGPSSSKLFAAVSSNIFEVTSSGAVGGAAVTSLTNAQWQHTMFATSGGNFLVAVNGADAPRNYSGSAWSTPTITVATPANFIDVVSHQRRLWFVEKNTTDAWYLPVESVAGAAVKFPLGPLFSMGGYLNSIATWTMDTGAGADDRLVFISSRGQAIVYAGTDPSDTSLWSLVGIYNVGIPIGRRCWSSFGGDLWLLTTEGVMSMSKILEVGREASQLANIAFKIGNAHTRAASLYGANFGWEMIAVPDKHLVIVNVPTAEASTSEQHVFNTVTGAWCKFTDLHTSCWQMLGSTLYVGGSGVVDKGLSGNSDKGANIRWEWASPWSGYLHPGRQKNFHMARLTIETPAAYFPSIGWDVDYSNRIPALGGDAPAVGSSVWDTGVWDTAVWSSENLSFSKWVGIAGYGFTGAAHILGATKSFRPKITALDVLYEAGGLV